MSAFDTTGVEILPGMWKGGEVDLTDTKNVIAEIDNCLTWQGCANCPYEDKADCKTVLLVNARDALQGHQSTPMLSIRGDALFYVCGSCGRPIMQINGTEKGAAEYLPNFCMWCGDRIIRKAVKSQ